MNTLAASPAHKHWSELYKAALFEADSNRLSERIALAEWALAVRARELFYTDEEHLQEQLAVDAAISALQTLFVRQQVAKVEKGCTEFKQLESIAEWALGNPGGVLR